MGEDTLSRVVHHLKPRPANAILRTASRVRAEFEEMPGVSLTLDEASRLFGVSPDDCLRVMACLIDEGAIILSRDGRYRLATSAA